MRRRSQNQTHHRSHIDIVEIIRNVQTAAEMCGAHGTHNDPINQFFSLEQNTRIDAYDGSFESRMRIALFIASSMHHFTHNPQRLA